MYKFLISNSAAKNTYDRIFKIIDSHSTFIQIETEDEYQTENGYVLEFKELPFDSIERICELKHVEQI